MEEGQVYMMAEKRPRVDILETMSNAVQALNEEARITETGEQRSLCGDLMATLLSEVLF